MPVFNKKYGNVYLLRPEGSNESLVLQISDKIVGKKTDFNPLCHVLEMENWMHFFRCITWILFIYCVPGFRPTSMPQGRRKVWKSGGGEGTCKGQTISEWIYEVKLSRFLPSLHRAEILTIFCLYFGRNDDFMNSFWNCLTFSNLPLWSE